jgi:hypothetical protein
MYPFWKLNRMLYMPACRLYARHAMAAGSPDRIMRLLGSVEFLMVHHYWPNLTTPSTFTEKLWRRMLFDRDPRFVLVSDKLRVRAYIEKVAGSEYLVPLLWSGNNPDEIPWQILPAAFAIKATHGCGYNVLVQDKASLDLDSTQKQLRHWLHTNYGKTFGIGAEWCYRRIPPSIIIEEFLEEDGRSARDYKLWCFAGRVECLTVHNSRHQNHAVQTFDRNFKPYPYAFPLAGPSQTLARPHNLEDMVRIAENVAADFDFIRVDMYNVRGRIFTGELTVYPGGGFLRFLPRELDIRLGAKWPA